MGTSLLASLTLFSLVLFATTLDARPGFEPLPSEKCHDSSKIAIKSVDDHAKYSFSNNFEAGPSDLVYVGWNMEKSFVKDFEPRPSISFYHNGDVGLNTEKSFVKDFEPKPSVSVYHHGDIGLNTEKSFVKNFEPRPSVSVYQQGIGLTTEKSFVKDFKQSTTAHQDSVGLNTDKSFVKDFEPKPSVSVYQG